MLPVHVLEADHLQAVLQHHHLDEIQTAATKAMLKLFEEQGAAELVDPSQVVQGGSAEARLELIRSEIDADVVVLNRFASLSRRRLRRLGRVARRTLRRLMSPVITVPPGLTADAIGKGPIIATTNLTPECDCAVEFAADLAKRLNREFVIVNVRRVPDHHATHYLPDESKNRLRDTRQVEAQKALEEWVEGSGHRPNEVVALLGEVVGNVTEFAEQRDACMIVAGSRRLSKIERYLLTSVGRGLSATAPCAVAVVPATEAP